MRRIMQGASSLSPRRDGNDYADVAIAGGNQQYEYRRAGRQRSNHRRRNNGTVIDIPIFAPAVSMTISGLTITGGRNTEFASGGAITNHGTFTLLNSVLTGNSGSEAGGIQTHGAVIVRNSSLVNNTGGRPPDVPCCQYGRRHQRELECTAGHHQHHYQRQHCHRLRL